MRWDQVYILQCISKLAQHHLGPHLCPACIQDDLTQLDEYAEYVRARLPVFGDKKQSSIGQVVMHQAMTTRSCKPAVLSVSGKSLDRFYGSSYGRKIQFTIF